MDARLLRSGKKYPKFIESAAVTDFFSISTNQSHHLQPSFSQEQIHLSTSFFINMPGGDSRRVVGSKVVAKAVHVTNLAECKRRYGANAKKKEVVGIITEVIATKTRTNRNATHIAATYYMGETTTKRKTLNIRSVRAATDVETQQVVDHENSENENEDVVVNPTDSPPPSPPPLSPPTGPTDNEEQKSESSDEENNNDEEENDDDADEDAVFSK